MSVRWPLASANPGARLRHARAASGMGARATMERFEYHAVGTSAALRPPSPQPGARDAATRRGRGPQESFAGEVDRGCRTTSFGMFGVCRVWEMLGCARGKAALASGASQSITGVLPRTGVSRSRRVPYDAAPCTRCHRGHSPRWHGGTDPPKRGRALSGLHRSSEAINTIRCRCGCLCNCDPLPSLSHSEDDTDDITENAGRCCWLPQRHG